jgi:hypothetical protein
VGLAGKMCLVAWLTQLLVAVAAGCVCRCLMLALPLQLPACLLVAGLTKPLLHNGWVLPPIARPGCVGATLQVPPLVRQLMTLLA